MSKEAAIIILKAAIIGPTVASVAQGVWNETSPRQDRVRDPEVLLSCALSQAPHRSTYRHSAWESSYKRGAHLLESITSLNNSTLLKWLIESPKARQFSRNCSNCINTRRQFSVCVPTRAIIVSHTHHCSDGRQWTHSETCFATFKWALELDALLTNIALTTIASCIPLQQVLLLGFVK